MLDELRKSGYEYFGSFSEQCYNVKKYFGNLIFSVSDPVIKSVGQLFSSISENCSTLVGRVTKFPIFSFGDEGTEEEREALIKTKELAEKVLVSEDMTKASQKACLEAANLQPKDKAAESAEVIINQSGSSSYSFVGSFGEIVRKFQSFFGATKASDIPWVTSGTEGKKSERS